MHVQRLLYLDRDRPALAQAAILNTTAGLCAGDRLNLSVQVASGAEIELTTPTSTRIFSMGDGFAESGTQIGVESGGYLEYLARPVILCRDASLRLRTSLAVEASGIAVVGDVIAFGRNAAGERHRYRWLDQRTDLRFDGTVVLAESLRLNRDEHPEAVGVVAGAAAFGALHVVGALVDQSQLITEARRIIDEQRDVWGGVSTLHAGAGISVRVLGDHAHAVYESLRAVTLAFRRRHFASARP
jgi:urease accessory protein